MSLGQIRQQLERIDESADMCKVVVPLLREAHARLTLVELKHGLYDAEIRCAVGRQAFDEALNFYHAWEAEGGDLSSTYGLYLAASAANGAESAQRLEEVLLSGDPQELQELNPDLAFFAMRAARADGLDTEIERISGSAARAGALDFVQPVLRASLAANAMATAADDTDLARRLFIAIDQPEPYAELLALRSYEALWPLAEERVGLHYRDITAAFRTRAKAAFEAEPKNADALNDFTHALYYEGDFEGAIALVDSALDRADLAETLEEQEAWALNIKAYSLDALGRVEEADAVFDLIGSVGDEPESWRVNFVINRASRIVGQGRWEVGLPAAELAGQFAETHGTPYARALTLRDRICALEALGRGSEALPLVERLRAEAKDRVDLLAVGLMCLNRDDEAAQLVIAALDDQKQRPILVEALQDEAMDLFYTRSIIRQPRDMMATHPELMQAFLKYARLIPGEYYPAASLTR